MRVAAAGGTTKANPKDRGCSRRRCFLVQVRSPPAASSPLAAADSPGVCMSSLAWASPGDHVGGRARPLQCPGRGQRCGHAPAAPRAPPVPARGPLGSAGQPGLRLGPGPERHEISRRLARGEVEGTWRRRIC